MDSVFKSLGEFPILPQKKPYRKRANKPLKGNAELKETKLPKPSALNGNGIKSLIIGWLKSINYFAWRQNTVGIKKADGSWRANNAIGSINGVADILGIVPANGRFFAIEVKGPGDIISEDQKQFLLDVNRNGGFGMIAHSLQDVKDRFKSAGLYPFKENA